ncbi:MAG: hypothetical protein ACE5DN_01435, partial [Flavobacteriales bacterium]
FILLIAVRGTVAVHCLIYKIRRKFLRQSLACIILLAVGSDIACSLWFIAANHPHQNMYFNLLAGNDIEQTHELDYWGLSYRQGFEYLLAQDDSDSVKIHVTNKPGWLNPLILTKKQRTRIKLAPMDNAAYYLCNYRTPILHKGLTSKDFPFDDEMYAIRVNGVRIMGIYRLH